MRDWRRELQWPTARKTAEANALSVTREVHAATEVECGAGRNMLGAATGAFQSDRLKQLKPCVVPVDASSRIAGRNMYFHRFRPFETPAFVGETSEQFLA